MKLNKAQVTRNCRETFRLHPDLFKGDKVAQQQYWNDYTDSLCKGGEITEHQYNTWSNPF